MTTSHSDRGSQCARILRRLKAGHRLTAIEALRAFGCFRLAARIKDLRNAGHAIRCESVTLPNGKRIGRYRL